MLNKIKYEFNASPWQHASLGGWYFISLPKDIAKEIREHFQWQEEGWGRIRVEAKIGKTQWQTAIWFDTKLDTYLLPLKAEVRKREQVEINRNILTAIWI